MKQRVIWDEASKGIYSSIDSTNPLKATVSKVENNALRTNIGFTEGKFYMEFTLHNGNYGTVGVCNENFTNTLNSNSTEHVSYYYSYNTLYPSGATINLPKGTAGDILKVKLDLDNKYIYFGINNLWHETGFAITGTTFYPMLMNLSTGYSAIIEANFGETDFVYDIPDGYISPDMLFRPILLKVDNNYYSIKDEHYNIIEQQYNPLPSNFKDNIGDYEFLPIELLTEKTIDFETFRPIDKFSKFKIVSQYEFYNSAIYGLKTNKALLIAKESFSTRLAENIDFFELLSEITNNSSIKMALSIDNGLTWKTWDSVSNSFIDLTNTVPLKEYDTLTEDEKTQWTTFMNEVYADGINASDLKNIDFNAFETDSMMFAYVFDRDSYEDTCTMSKLQYQFDAYGSYKLLGENDVIIKQGIDNISVTPNKDIELMKVNIGSSGTVNINNGEDIDLPTDEEIDNMVNEVINNVFA